MVIKFAADMGFTLEAVAAMLDGDAWHPTLCEQIALLTRRIDEAERLREMLNAGLACPSSRPIRECPHFIGLLDDRLASPGAAPAGLWSAPARAGRCPSPAGTRDQLRTSDTVRDFRPCDSATASLVISPPAVFNPCASAASSASARRQPLSASATA